MSINKLATLPTPSYGCNLISIHLKNATLSIECQIDGVNNDVEIFVINFIDVIKFEYINDHLFNPNNQRIPAETIIELEGDRWLGDDVFAKQGHHHYALSMLDYGRYNVLAKSYEIIKQQA